MRKLLLLSLLGISISSSAIALGFSEPTGELDKLTVEELAKNYTFKDYSDFFSTYKHCF